jgi:hypothetical protein
MAGKHSPAGVRRQLYPWVKSGRITRLRRGVYLVNKPPVEGRILFWSQIISIKIEIDTNPLAGARTETTILRRFFLLNIMHYDKSSLLAGKLYALLTRAYTKGRDLFDLVWYLSDPQWPAPNIPQLNNALERFGWTGPEVAEDILYVDKGVLFQLLDRHSTGVT